MLTSQSSRKRKVMEEDKTKEPIETQLKCETERLMECILQEGIDSENIELLGEIVDIHKDLANEEYWEAKKEVMSMRYGTYGRRSYNEGSYSEYGEGRYGRRGRERDSRGRYSEGRGSGRYRGEEMMDEMMYHYGNYTEGREMYGNDHETLKSFKYMLKSFKDYYKHLKQEASSQEEIQLLEETAREMLEM